MAKEKKPTKAAQVKKAVKENDRRGKEAAKRTPIPSDNVVPPGTIR